MYKYKLCMGLGCVSGVDGEEQIRLIKQSGFDGFFSEWNDEVGKYRQLADELGLIYQSIHAPFLKAADMWKDNEAAQIAVDELLACLADCAKYHVPIMVVHTYIGFDKTANPTATGVENFRRVVEAAAECNVKVAFENTEGEEYLAALMEAFRGYDNVGFCWDTGHELCYNMGKDMTALYGDRLICTHINDNLGILNFEGEIDWRDDLHLLPFDGIVNWQSVADRLNKWGYDDIMTFELTTKSKPRRHDNDKYAKLSAEEYITEAFARACRVAALR